MHFLDFDYSEDPQGAGTFEAMASVRPEQVAAVRAEIAQVLDWAHAAFPNMRAPLDEGGEWDFNLQDQPDGAKDETGDASSPWHTLTLSISGSPQFCAAFSQHFESE